MSARSQNLGAVHDNRPDLTRVVERQGRSLDGTAQREKFCTAQTLPDDVV